MSETQSKPLTFKGIVAVVGAGLIALIAKFAGVDLEALAGKGDAGAPDQTEARKEMPKEASPDAGTPPVEAPAVEAPKPETPKEESKAPLRDDTNEIRKLFRAMRSDAQVEAEGEIVHILPDDLKGSKHQLFLVELSNDITLKISHNIDIAPKVPIQKGDTIRFHGEYEYNDKGGVVHWTHRTLGNNPHPHGWLLHKGKKYD